MSSNICSDNERLVHIPLQEI